MSVKWTDDQQLAIDTTDRGVVVSAAAGSGKTAVLIERTINLLADRTKNVPADRLLAVTFTVDATTQMKEKLSSAFEKKIAVEQNLDQKKWLQKQQDKLAMAKISTINSFCLDLVNSNINEFDLQDGIKIIDDTEADLIVSDSIDKAIDDLSENSPADLDFLVDVLSNNNENQVANNVRELYKFLSSLAFPDSWISEQEKSFTDEEKIKMYIEILVDEYSERLDDAIKENELAVNIFHNNNSNLNFGEKVITVLNDECEKLKLLKKHLGDYCWEDFYNEFKNNSFGRMTFYKPKEGEFPEGVLQLRDANIQLIKNHRDKYKDIVSDINKSLGKIGVNIRDDMLTARCVFQLLCGLCKSAEQYAWAAKVEKNSLQFSDVERMSIELLVKYENGNIARTPLADEIVNNRDYQVILIDEFQDVNNLQELIFKAISDTDDLDFLGKNVFVVGDVKQAIYRFRKSNPKLFLQARENARQNENSEILKSIDLKSNFRSRKNIIDFVNYLFENIMSEQVGEVDYSGSERLQLGANYAGENLDTEILMIRSDKDSADSDSKNSEDDKDSGDADEDEYVLFTQENLVVAKRIRQLIDEGHPVYSSGDEKSRPCTPSDFCVLARTAETTSKLSAALESVGLKAFCEETKGYIRSREISVMINLLKVIDNPMNDIALASVMMSPVMSFNADEIAGIRRLCIESGKYTKRMYQVMNAVAKDDDSSGKESEKLCLNDNALEQKCCQSIELIKRLRFYSSGMSLSRLIRKIYDETDFYAVASAFENSKQKRANLRLLLEYASTYENSGEGGISGFIRYFEAVSESGNDFKQAVTVTEGGDCVFVKTIHKSKGLEYPFVFLCGVGKKFYLKDLQGNMLMDEQVGVGFELLNHANLSRTNTLSYSAMQSILRDKLLSEEIRLLYVALTRAKEKIFIPITIKESSSAQYDTRKIIAKLADDISRSGGINSRIIRSGDSYLKWLCAVLLCYPNNLEFLEEMQIKTEMPQLDTDTLISFNLIEDCDAFENSKPSFIEQKANQKLVDKLSERYAFEYVSKSMDVPSKITVTEFVRKEKELELGEENPEFYPQLPKLSDEIGKLSSAQKGTYTHLFMELADYEKASQNVSAELDRLVSQGYFSEKEASGVYVSAVEKFFSGDFYRRMSDSDEIIREKQFLVSFSNLNLPEKYSEYVTSGSMLQGIADCIFKEDDGYILVDYKTDNFTDESQLYEYQSQLELYKAALDLILGIPIKTCYIYSFRLNKGVEIDMNA